jgi:hypothetical protein
MILRVARSRCIPNCCISIGSGFNFTTPPEMLDGVLTYSTNWSEPVAIYTCSRQTLQQAMSSAWP